MNKVYLKHSVI